MTTCACRMARKNLVIKVNVSLPPRNLSCLEIFHPKKFLPLGNLFSPGNSYHWEIFVIGKSFPPRNPNHREFLPTRKSFHQEIFPPGNPSHRDSGIPSHQEILHNGNSFPPGNPSPREFLPIRKSFTPGNSSQLTPG